MKNIVKVTDLIELKKLYDSRAYIFEDCGHQDLESLLELYGDGEAAAGYLFTADLLYQVCKLPEDSSLPKDRKYLAIIPPKEMFMDTSLETITSKIWQISNYTGFNAFEQARIFVKE